MKIIYKKVKPSVCKQNREFYKNHVRRAFIMYVAYEGYLDGVFSKEEIENAKRGILPNDCNIHHKIPLSSTDDKDVLHSFSNLTIIHEDTHKYINRYVFQPQLVKICKAPYGTQIEIEVPDFDFVDSVGIIRERQLKKWLQRYEKEL